MYRGLFLYSEDTEVDMKQIQSQIQEFLLEGITHFSLKASGLCNDAYYVETSSGSKYIVKRERPQKELTEQNSLPVEGRLIQALGDRALSIPLPRIAFISQDPAMYGYEYIEGEQLITVWHDLADGERIGIFRTLGMFHAELGRMVSKEAAAALGLTVDESAGLHPEVAVEYEKILASDDVSESWKELAREAKTRFDRTLGQTMFQFIHNDAHHEHVLIHQKRIAGMIDFGDAEYGEVAKEFSRYIRDYPRYFQHIVAAYEAASGHALSRDRLIGNAFLSGLMDNVAEYRQGGATRKQAEASLATYRQLLSE